MEGIKPIFIMIVDISGYTRFIQYHKVSLIHAEKIISELMESILAQVEVPVHAHEILGDAITFYSIDNGTPYLADRIYQQLNNYFTAFREREASLISECNLCNCEACQQVGKLRLKGILHYGEVAFTTIMDKLKISGEDVIISHRLLKNNVPSHEYILMTNAYAAKCQALDTEQFTTRIEAYDDVGSIPILVKLFEDVDVKAKAMSFWKRLRGMMVIDGYMIKRLFVRNEKVYKNLPV